MSSSRSETVVVFFLATLIGLSAAARGGAAYEEFRSFHRKGQSEDSVSYVEREAIFKARKQEVATHNAKQESWKMTLNHFADYTQAELQAMMGYKRVGGRWDQSSFLQLGGDGSDTGNVDVSQLAKTVDWRSSMNFSNFVHDQGACGSCWAHAAVAALEAHAELTSGVQHQLSTQEIIDCSANPLHCGGTGGCQGATAEIALEHARKHGIAFKDSYREGGCSTVKESAVNIHSFVRLPENRASHLMQALSKQGPVVMSVDANNLHLYDSGVFSGCTPDTVVNHAVLGVGYGHDSTSGMDYWQIKNSWGEHWGETGYFRIQKKDDDRWHCGMDNKPQEGVYCDKHPEKIEVCGMCGITSDSVYPVIVPPKANLRHTVATKLGKVAPLAAKTVPVNKIVTVF